MDHLEADGVFGRDLEAEAFIEAMGGGVGFEDGECERQASGMGLPDEVADDRRADSLVLIFRGDFDEVKVPVVNIVGEFERADVGQGVSDEELDDLAAGGIEVVLPQFLLLLLIPAPGGFDVGANGVAVQLIEVVVVGGRGRAKNVHNGQLSMFNCQLSIDSVLRKGVGSIDE